MTRFALPLLFLFCLVASCDVTVDSKDIPQPYHDKIAKFRDENLTIARKCADLQKQIADLQAQQTWNTAQLSITSNEALNSLGISAGEWTVDVDRMKIRRKK